jgi:hypothetical protein
MRICESTAGRRRLVHAAVGAAAMLVPGALATEAFGGDARGQQAVLLQCCEGSPDGRQRHGIHKPTEAALTKKVTWYFSGFRRGKFIYAHYLHKKPAAQARFGRATGPCGLLKVKARFYPGGHPRFKTYTVQIDDSKRYSKHASPKIVTKLGTFAF